MKRPIAPLQASEIARMLGLDLAGPDACIDAVSPFPPQAEGILCFHGKSDGGMPRALPAGCLVIARAGDREALLQAGSAVIVSTNPKYDFCRLFSLLGHGAEWGVHPSAQIGPRAVLAKRVAIGPGCVLDGDIRVGEGSRISANVVLRNAVTIGRDVSIRNGSVIGENAFSFGFSDPDHARADAIRFPCFGGVVIGDRAEIGNNCVISRGTFRDTVIGERARINDLAHLGNEVEVGERSTVTAHCDISARVKIGKGCWIGQSAAVRQGLTIGDGATVGMGAVVLADVAPGTVVMGVPARFKRDA